MFDFDEKVQAGIAVLDEKGIDWRPAALHPDLDMANMELCILGRSVPVPPGNWWSNGYMEVQNGWGNPNAWMEAHGFFVSDATIMARGGGLSSMYVELADAWRRAAQESPESLPV